MTARYMIYLPADAPGRLIRCDDGDTCKLETLQQLVGGLIGFAKPVCETICEEFGIDMEDGIWND